MSSKRLPGKVLLDIAGIPILKRVVESCQKVSVADKVVVATSNSPSDEEIIRFCDQNSYEVILGSLTNVYQRYLDVLQVSPCDAFVRVCADSPFIDDCLIYAAINLFDEFKPDLVTNVFPRSFPAGQSIEVIKSKTFASAEFSKQEYFSKEHVTQTFYKHPEHYEILNMYSAPILSRFDRKWAIDTKHEFDEICTWEANNSSIQPRFTIGQTRLDRRASSDA